MVNDWKLSLYEITEWKRHNTRVPYSSKWCTRQTKVCWTGADTKLSSSQSYTIRVYPTVLLIYSQGCSSVYLLFSIISQQLCSLGTGASIWGGTSGYWQKNLCCSLSLSLHPEPFHTEKVLLHFCHIVCDYFLVLQAHRYNKGDNNWTLK